VRKAELSRETKETSIRIALDLDAREASQIDTGNLIFDHLLAQFAFHSRVSVRLNGRSLDGIRHHVVEDAAITLAQALNDALGTRAGIARYGEAIVPMDDALVRAVVDFGGRIYARTALDFRAERIEDLETVMIPHVFSSIAANARATIHIDRLAGDDPHHVAEAAFKALGRACASAWAIDPRISGVASTKGMLV
jgi:imidazoleglycerol-phosphate dehydratase